MNKKKRIVRYSAEKLAAMESKTNWAKVDAITQKEVERIADKEDGPFRQVGNRS